MLVSFPLKQCLPSIYKTVHQILLLMPNATLTRVKLAAVDMTEVRGHIVWVHDLVFRGAVFPRNMSNR